MARFKAGEEDHYGGSGGTGYFSLKNDKDVAQVRFLYDSIDDVEGYAVHPIKIDDKTRYVNCLRAYGDPIDNCPFCREKMYTAAKLFIPLYNIDEDKVQTWERGKKFFSKISSLCSRYPNLVSHVFEIERNGKPKETTTTYEIYEVDNDDSTIEDFPEPLDVLGSIILDKSAEDMEYYLESGQFPPEEDEQPVVRRRGQRQQDDEAPRERTDRGRRTPANSRKKEVF